MCLTGESETGVAKQRDTTANNGSCASNGAILMVTTDTTPGSRHSVLGTTYRPRLVLAWSLCDIAAMAAQAEPSPPGVISHSARQHRPWRPFHPPGRPPQRSAAAQLRSPSTPLPAQA
jgi:hypothetical protein